MRHVRSILFLIVAFVTFFPAQGFAASLQVNWTANNEEDLAATRCITAQTRALCPDRGCGELHHYTISSAQAGFTYYGR
jgi:hypothetical protein